jgi:O-methyltransferase domain
MPYPADQPEQSEIEDRLRSQIEAYHATGLAYACVKLALPETMGTEAWTAERLAAALGLSAPHLKRTLQGLVTLGLVEERGEAFALTQTGQALKPGAPSHLREKLLIVVEQYWQPWANVARAVRDGRPAFDLVFGETVGDWRRHHSDHGAVFESYLESETFTHAGPIVEALDFTGVATVAEIGGGHGALLAAVLLAQPHLHGILMDAPYKLSGARVYLHSHGLTERVALAKGDATAEVAVAADLYLLKAVLQQHGDATAQAILTNLRRAMPDGARLVVIERLMPEKAADDPAAIMLDLHMMTITGGKARTRPEMEALIVEAGLAIAGVSKTDGGLAVIECVPR